MRLATIKLLEEKGREKLLHIGLGSDFLAMHQKPSHKRKNE
jgi:hypothetical protein